MPGVKGAKTSGGVFSGRRPTLEYFGSMGEPVLGHQRIFAILVLLLTVNPAFTGKLLKCFCTKLFLCVLNLSISDFFTYRRLSS